MKKIITIILICTIFCLSCACSANSKSTSVVKQYEYYAPFKTYWGMSKEDCMKELGVKDSKVSQGEKTDYDSNFQVELSFLGKKGTAVFVFTDKDLENGKNLGLTSIGFHLDDIIPLNNLLPKIQAELKENGLSYSEPNCNVANVELYNMKLTDSSRNNSSKDNSSKKGGYALKPSGANSIDMIALRSRELSVKPGDNPNIISVVFHGKGAAMLYHKDN